MSGGEGSRSPGRSATARHAEVVVLLAKAVIAAEDEIAQSGLGADADAESESPEENEKNENNIPKISLSRGEFECYRGCPNYLDSCDRRLPSPPRPPSMKEKKMRLR